MIPERGFTIETADYQTQRDALHLVRHQVFVLEQGVPAELEVDALDPASFHVLARDQDGQPIGTGRLTPDHRIGRMAVLSPGRDQGIGDALVLSLVEEARRRNWPQLELHAQMSARSFYGRHGFLPYGDVFEEAGIDHQSMRLRLDGPVKIADLESAIFMTAAIIQRARRQLVIHSQDLDPAIWSAPVVQRALRRFAVTRHDKQARIVLHDVLAFRQSRSPLITLAQRLPSVFQFREPIEPGDQSIASACLFNDAGDYYFRLLGNSHHGEAALALPAHSRIHEARITQLWERCADCAELRTVGL
jgi:predicted GNAT family N-acyltransferase